MVLQDFRGDLVEQKIESLRKHSSRLLSVAKQHECYSILWEICCDLNDPELLRKLMVCSSVISLLHLIFANLYIIFL